MNFSRVLALSCSVLLALTLSAKAEAPLLIEAKRKVGDEWGKLPTRTFASLPALPEDSPLDRFGGLTMRKGRASGFFHPEKITGRWWLVDPDGGLFLCKGIVSVAPGSAALAKAKFGDEAAWAKQTTALLRVNGFNSVGAWSDTALLRAVAPPLVYTRIWNFMSSYGKKRGGTTQGSGHTAYPGDCIFVFDPEFESFCDEHAKQLAADKNDPWLLGHFSDNELPFKMAALRNYLALPETDAGHRAAIEWLRKRHGASATAKDIQQNDERDFLSLVVERYHRIVSTAIRRYDPNHLFLGSRLHGEDLKRANVIKAAGPFLDVVSLNYYGAWSPDPQLLAMWERESGRPVLITEWYAKGADSGMGNTTGAGWLVKTQRDRGLFYQNFVLGLLESDVCVGWHWFKYADNDPNNPKADPSNRDSNKGIVTADLNPWTELLDATKSINARAYGIADYFQHKGGRSPQAR